MKHELFSMNLHQEIIDGGFLIKRIPSGWLYVHTGSGALHYEKDVNKKRSGAVVDPSLDDEDSFRSAKGLLLKGKFLDGFNQLVIAYGRIKGRHAGKAEAADSFMQTIVPLLKKEKDGGAELWETIMKAAKKECKERNEETQSPKYLQGWITGRRWEDL